jgi:hypothetical protein
MLTYICIRARSLSYAIPCPLSPPVGPNSINRIESDAAWVNISLNGAPVNLLVTESGEVLARKSMEGRGQHAGGGDALLQPH